MVSDWQILKVQRSEILNFMQAKSTPSNDVPDITPITL
jgi:hypothetical protein